MEPRERNPESKNAPAAFSSRRNVFLSRGPVSEGIRRRNFPKGGSSRQSPGSGEQIPPSKKEFAQSMENRERLNKEMAEGRKRLFDAFFGLAILVSGYFLSDRFFGILQKKGLFGEPPSLLEDAPG